MRHLPLALALVVAAGLTALVPPADAASTLYWIDTNYAAPTLNRADANGVQVAGVALPVASLPEGLALDAAGRLYWAEAALSGARIMRASANFASAAPLVSGGTACRGIAVDDVAQTIYWTSSNLVMGPKVYRASLVDGSGVAIIEALPMAANPRGICVDHAGGKIYWADFSQDAIYRANLDGSAMELWFSMPAQTRPYGVAFDAATQNLYWTEYSGQVRRRPVTGPAGATTLVTGLSNPTYIALDPANFQMYWAEAGAGAQHVYRASMNGGSKTMLPTPLTSYGGLAFQPNYPLDAPIAGTPADFSLAPLAPNPARGPVDTWFALPREAHVRLSVLDLQGRVVAVLEDAVLPAGRHVATWNTARRPAAAGMYFVRLAADGRTWVRRVVITP